MKIRAVFECDVTGIDAENMQAELEAALYTFPFCDDVSLVEWHEIAEDSK